MTERLRSLTHGTCALDGQHANPKIVAECPVLRKRQRASEAIETPPLGRDTGASETCPAKPHEQRGFETGFYPPSTRGARRGGRPRKHASDVIARREARRAYRERQKARDDAR